MESLSLKRVVLAFLTGMLVACALVTVVMMVEISICDGRNEPSWLSS